MLRSESKVVKRDLSLRCLTDLAIHDILVHIASTIDWLQSLKHFYQCVISYTCSQFSDPINWVREPV